MPRRVFLERHGGKWSISVDRLDFAEPEEMATLGDSVAVGRSSVDRKVSFYGWPSLPLKTPEAVSGRCLHPTTR